MSDFFRTAALGQKPLHPFKRVNYSMGLVLGVDEFEQEQYYLMERDRLHHRALHGYGTVYGLDVQYRDGEVQVMPGLAVDSRGQHICVDGLRCADLNKWLADHEDEILAEFDSVPGPLPLYVTLCYRECKSDNVPVPGEPCRTQADSMVASRIQDDFELKLSLLPPAQPSEAMLDRFGDLLARIEIRANAASYLDSQAVDDLVLGLLDAGSPPDGSLPEAQELYLHPDEARELLEQAFRTWVTRVRGELMAADCGAGDDDACLLLARLNVSVAAGSQGPFVDGGDEAVEVDPRERPFLLHSRLLQEWLLTARLSRTLDVSRQFVSLFVPNPQVLRVWLHHPAPLDLPAGSVRVLADETELVLNAPVPVAAGTNVFEISLDRLLAYGTRVEVVLDLNQISAGGQPLLEQLDNVEYALLDREAGLLRVYCFVDTQLLDNLNDVDAAAPAANQVLTWTVGDNGAGLWTPQTITAIQVGDAAGSDLSGTYPNPTVVKIQGKDVSDATPNPGDVLIWDGSAWVPGPQQGGGSGGDAQLETGLVHIVGLSWQHGADSPLRINLEMASGVTPTLGLVVVFARERPGDDGLVRFETVNENTFQVFTEQADPDTGFLGCLRIPAQRIAPVTLARPDQPNRLFVNVQEMDVTPEGKEMFERGLAPAVLFQLNPETQLKPLLAGRLRVLLKGDFILDGDPKPRAIDAEHLRGDLPTGNNVNGRNTGLQGGLFESWLSVRLDLNRITAVELATITGSLETANRIIELRGAAGGFRNITDFNTRVGAIQLPRETLQRIRQTTTFIK